MSITEKDWRDEQNRVDSVVAEIGERILQVEEEVGRLKVDIVDIRKNFWDDVTVNLSNPSDIAETYSSMKQQAEVLSGREHSHRHSTAELSKLTRLHHSPYFGRIDFLEDETGGDEQIYLGIASFLDEDGETHLVYDWRAPISSIYYDFAPGPVSFQTPGGEVTGTMSLKRQYVIRDGRIHFMFDTGLTIGDELLQQVLSRSSDAQMKSIVATIQKEQNRIIRNDSSRMLIVQGVAGSGKTSAALQRVAYLLYKYRNTLTADQMVLFSPNPLFNSYVSTVLPELGEDNMQQTTFQQYLEHRLGKEFDLEDPFSQIEYVLTCTDCPGYEAKINGIRFKSSDKFMKVIQAYKDALEQEGMIFKSIKLKGREIVSAERIGETFYAFDRSIRLPNRISLLRDWLLEELTQFEQTEWQQPWVEDEIELLEPEDYQRAYKQMRRNPKGMETFGYFDKEKEFLSRMVLHTRLKPLRKRIRSLRFVDIPALYRQLFADENLFRRMAGEHAIPENWITICRQTTDKIDRSELAYEDATPYLYLKELMQGFQTNNSVRHIIVDEAQDYTPFQLEFLKRLFPRCRMTALGDRNQAIYTHASVLDEFDPLTELYGPEQTQIIRLSRSYRSTRQIVEFTRGIIPGGESIVPFNREGEKPKITVAEDLQSLHNKIEEDIDALIAEGYESIAVICKTANESLEAYEGLNKRLSLRLITKNTPSFEKAALVIPAYLAKGLEFDAVIIYNGSRELYGRQNERKLFYTACTRAMHLLRIYALQELSPFVTSQNSDTYVLE